MAERETPNLALLREVAQRIESLLPRLAFLGGVFWRRARCQPCSRLIWAPMKRAKLVSASYWRGSKPWPDSAENSVHRA